MLVFRWFAFLLAGLMPAMLVACRPLSSSSSAVPNLIETQILSKHCTHPDCSTNINILSPPRNQPQIAKARPIHTKRQTVHTENSGGSRLTRGQLIGLVTGLSIFAVILGIGLFLWILSCFPVAQERFCACFCGVCCPWLVKRTEYHDWEWD
ncbi:hypothetical protein BJX63DRAFT_53740 [Aspergillus granulosus]|uniref:Uncharacterized protein n=1 Tax=Aspergillus granulosus TaxID=176169 RepID=A0ABR4GXX0_9EURO